MKPTPTQGRRLIALLKRKPMTYMQMLSTGISTAPWKRVVETIGPKEELIKATNRDGLTVWYVHEYKRA